MALASACTSSTCGGRLYLCVVAQPSCCVVCVRCMPLGVDSHQPQQECTDAVPYVWVRYTVPYTGTVQSITDACLPTGLCCLFVVQPENVFNSLRNEHLIVIPRPPSARGPTLPGLPPNPRENTHTRARARMHAPATVATNRQTHKHQRAYAPPHMRLLVCARAPHRACVRQGKGTVLKFITLLFQQSLTLK
jgi:hypothetical protein